MKNEAIKVRLEEKDKEELVEVSTTLDIPSSQIVREAVREKIAELKRTHPLLVDSQTEPALAE